MLTREHVQVRTSARVTGKNWISLLNRSVCTRFKGPWQLTVIDVKWWCILLRPKSRYCRIRYMERQQCSSLSPHIICWLSLSIASSFPSFACTLFYLFFHANRSCTRKYSCSVLNLLIPGSVRFSLLFLCKSLSLSLWKQIFRISHVHRDFRKTGCNMTIINVMFLEVFTKQDWKTSS